ncbi:hypothetical protein LINPERHAP1_LOCUS14031 [Linum perenne]
MDIVDLDKSCFLVKLSVEQDYFKALMGGSWILLDHYIVVHQWELVIISETPTGIHCWPTNLEWPSDPFTAPR